MGAKTYYLQASFAGGEVSPSMYGRTDMAKFAVSAKTMLNFYPQFFGGASNRPGTKFICEVKDSSKKVKLLPFQFSTEQAYVIEAGNNYFRYIKDGGQIVEDSTIVETTTTYAEDKLFNLKTAQSADVLYICNSYYEPKTLTRSSHYDWSFAGFDYIYGPFRDQNVTTTKLTPSGTTGTITVTASSSVFTENMVGGLLQISHDVYAQSVHYFGISENTTDAIKVNGDWSFQLTDTYSAMFTIQISNDNGATWETLKTYGTTDASSAIQDSGNIDHYALLRVYSTADSDSGHSGAYTLSATAFINDAYLKIETYTSATSVTATVLTDSNKYIWGLASTNATADWAIGAWNTEYGFPACVKFYQNRLVFGSTTKDPLTLWLSQINDYNNFLIHPEVEDDDAITAPLVSQGVNAVRSMVSLSNMLAFTAGGEWKIGTGSDTTGLTSTTIRALQQGYRGSSTLEPLIIGDRVLYCQEMGSIVRDFGYSIADDAYKGDDLTLMAKHFFKNNSIVDWCFQQEPDGIIWAVRDDGYLLSFTYIKEQDVWAWAKHETDGEFESVCAIPADTYTAVYFVVKREINGSIKRYVEQLVPRMASTDPRDQFFVDCGLSFDNPIAITGATQASPIVITAALHGLSAGNIVDLSDIVGMTELNNNRYKVGTVTTNTFTLLNMDDDTNIDGTSFTAYKSSGYVRKCVKTISGLNHLESKTATILADGSVATSQTVSDGTITFDDYVSRVHVGLGYTCDLETLNIDLSLKDGTSQVRKKRIPKVTVLFENSYGGKIGINGSENLGTITPTLSTIMGQAGNLVTGYKDIQTYSAPSNNATVFIRQSDPLPMTVLSVIPEVVVGDDSTN